MTSRHFTDAELACHHCHLNRCAQKLVDALDELRDNIGKPIIVDDAYRCPEHNKEVGGVPDSQHVLGNAADIHVMGMTAAELYEFVTDIPEFTGIGRADYQGYVHVDVRDGKIAHWCYDQGGTQMAWYDPRPKVDKPQVA